MLQHLAKNNPIRSGYNIPGYPGGLCKPSHKALDVDTPYKKRIAVIQSSYIPWKGYFDIINSVDEFILYDDVQYTGRDWRSRNQVKGPHGLIWLSIPVVNKGKFTQKIREAGVADKCWGKIHWKTIRHAYGRARCFKTHANLFEAAFLDGSYQYLSDINHRFIRIICDFLRIKTKVSWSMDYQVPDNMGHNEKLVALCQQTGATEYLSGPKAKQYMDVALFNRNGIDVSFVDYSGYPVYEQLYPPFQHTVTILDLIFNTGDNATRYMKSFYIKEKRDVVQEGPVVPGIDTRGELGSNGIRLVDRIGIKKWQ